ncbi:MAG: uroporphyrinogen-III synthase [Acidobacteriota bacterium]|nr:uroporphyrinogen-III synthase [Acidobacteriota bacterium]
MLSNITFFNLQMQISGKTALTLKSELMFDAANEKTYALFANPANRKLIAELENTGARVFQFPPIDTEKIALDEKSVDYLRHLADFDWLIFSDVLTVDYFLEALEENAIDSFEMDLLRVCAFGEAVSDRLRFAAIHADIIPTSVEIDVVFAAMLDYIGGEELKSLKILFANKSFSENLLTKKLQASGAEVLELPIYKIKFEKNLEIAKLKTLLEVGAIDEFIFTAPDDFVALKQYFESEMLFEIFKEVKVTAADAVNFQTAREHKLETVGLFHLDKLGRV